MADIKDSIKDTVETAKDKLGTAKDKLPAPAPTGVSAQANAKELKDRLLWGEPGLTIVDVRDRAAFNERHIMGAMPMLMDTLVERAQSSSLEPTRDIYVYGAGDEETTAAANQLREAGFRNVAELKGGIKAWQEIEGPTEGTATNDDPVSAGEYNLASRLSEAGDLKDKEDAQRKNRL